MTRDTKELERVLEELEKLGQLVSKTSWDEVADLWGLMYENYKKLGCERALLIIEQLFADSQLRKQVGAARQLRDISQQDQPPGGVLVLLKGAKAQLTKNMNDYVKAANKEMANIQKVREQQSKMVGWVSFSFITIGTAVGNNIFEISSMIGPVLVSPEAVLFSLFIIVLLLALGWGLGKLFRRTKIWTKTTFLWSTEALNPSKRRVLGMILLAMFVLLLLAGLVIGALVQGGFISASEAPEVSENWQPQFLI
jgi:hypothetical protein